MTPKEARLNLDACTLRPGDAEEEARLLAQGDAALSAWLEKRTAQDEKLADVYNATSAPKGLNDRLLAAMLAEVTEGPTDAYSPEPEAGHGETSQPHTASTRPALMPWLALAAVLVLSAAGLWWNAQQPPAWQGEALAMIKQVNSGKMRLDEFSGDLNKLKAVLTRAQVPSPENLPKDFSQLASLGCKVVQIAGRPASVVCFKISPGKEAHLLTFKVSGLPGAPSLGPPQFASREGWHVATWREGDQGYFLATQAEEAKLKGLFAILWQTGDWGRWA